MSVWRLVLYTGVVLTTLPVAALTLSYYEAGLNPNPLAWTIGPIFWVVGMFLMGFSHDVRLD